MARLGWWNGYRVAIGLIVAVAVALRAYHLGEQSLWIDELADGTAVQTPFPQFFVEVRRSLGAAPLDYLGSKLFTLFLGHDTIATRSWAFAMGCLAVYLIYVLGARLYNDRMVGLIAAAMLAVSAFHIYYSQEARFYSLQVVVAILSLITFLRALDSGAAKDWALYGLASALTLYTHYFLAMLLPIEGLYVTGKYLWLVWRQRPALPVRRGVTQVAMCLAAQVGAVLVFVPWLAFALRNQLTASGYGLLPALGLAKVHQIFVVMIGLAPLNSNPPAGIGQLVRTDLVLGLAALGLVWALALRRFRVVLLAAIVVAAVPVAWRLDQVGSYFWSERQIIYLLVPLYLLAAIGVRHLLAVAGRLASGNTSADRAGAWVPRLALALVPLWLVLYWGPIQLVYHDRWETKEDWRGLTAFIDRAGCPGTQYWTWVDSQLSYGIGYYDRSLLPRSHFLYALPDGSYAPSTVDAVQRQSLVANDWIVIGSTDPDAAALRGLGWQATPFLGLVAYHQKTCGT